MMQRERERPGYIILSEYRSELMGAAMLWVMLYHCFPVVIPFFPLDAVKRLGYGGVDMFLFLSGMGLAVSSLKRRRSYGAYLARRVVRILPAFYIVAVPFILWKLLTGRIALKNALWSLTLLGYWLGTPDHFNWYVSGLLAFYLLAPLLILILAKAGRGRDLVILCAVLLDIALCELLMRVGLARLLDFFFRIPIFWIGIRLGFAVFEEKPLTRSGCLFWALLLVLGMLYIYFGRFSLVYYLSPNYGFILTTVPLCLLLCFLMKKLPLKPLWSLLALIGTCSLEIYLLNAAWFIQFDLFSRLLGVSPAVYCLIGVPVNLLAGVGLHFGTEALRKRLGRGP